jgi:hypothetical protein
MRPFGTFDALAYAVRAGLAHYRFARRDWRRDAQINGIGLVVTSRAPTQHEMDDVGCRWSDYSRMRGAQPIDPAVMWSDMAILWAAYHRRGEIDGRRTVNTFSVLPHDPQKEK